MNKTLYILPLLFVILFAMGWILTKKSNEVISSDPGEGIAVVELFTSEGCSSCPPADETVARLLAKKKTNVFILSYHVDYWNRLGWKDPFSKAGFSKRQSDYASAFHLESVYTPQVIVNGSAEFVGSEENKLAASIDQSLLTNPSINLNIAVKRIGNRVDIAYEVKGNDLNNQFLNFALVQNEASIAVKKGENEGRILRHVNIVRELKTITAASSGSVVIEMEDKTSTNTWQIIAFTQEKKNLHISGATQKPL